jgi:hypothetical protein
MKRVAMVEADEKNKLSRKLGQDSGFYVEGYGDV